MITRRLVVSVFFVVAVLLGLTALSACGKKLEPQVGPPSGSVETAVTGEERLSAARQLVGSAVAASDAKIESTLGIQVVADTKAQPVLIAKTDNCLIFRLEQPGKVNDVYWLEGVYAHSRCTMLVLAK